MNGEAFAAFNFSFYFIVHCSVPDVSHACRFDTIVPRHPFPRFIIRVAKQTHRENKPLLEKRKKTNKQNHPSFCSGDLHPPFCSDFLDV